MPGMDGMELFCDELELFCERCLGGRRCSVWRCLRS